MDGAYEFRTDRADDRATFWIDLDKDGILKRNGGTAGDERLSWGNGGRIVDLKVGFYKVLIAHREGGGGSSIQASHYPNCREQPVLTPESSPPPSFSPEMLRNESPSTKDYAPKRNYPSSECLNGAARASLAGLRSARFR